MITDMRSILHWRRIRFLDVACRYDCCREEATRGHSVDDGCTEFSKRREAVIRKISGNNNKAEFMKKFMDRKKIQDNAQHTGYHCTKGRSQFSVLSKNR